LNSRRVMSPRLMRRPIRRSSTTWGRHRPLGRHPGRRRPMRPLAEAPATVSIESRYPRLRKKLRYAVLDAPATADAALRRAAYDGEDLAEPLSGYVETMRRYAYRVQDRDIERLHNARYSDDQVLEVTVAAALGAGDARLRVGLAALNEALR